MKTVETRSLLEESSKVIDIDSNLIDVFDYWKKKFKERTGKEPNDMDCMYAGYILSNPVVRAKYKEAKKLNL